MKIRRYKKVSKTISFYTNSFGFRQPYQLLVDGTFCYAALQNKINIADNIPRYLQGEVKLLTTQCAVVEMEKLGAKVGGALIILKKYGIHKCGHEKKPKPGSKCMLSMVGEDNKNHYIIATQDRDLQDKVRNIPGVPLLYLHLKTPVLEQPSEKSQQVSRDKLSGIGKSEITALEELKAKTGLAEEGIKKKRKKKGANPLSCKKKKRKFEANNPIDKKQSHTDSDKQKRKRVRIPKHVKEELLQKIIKQTQSN